MYNMCLIYTPQKPTGFIHLSVQLVCLSVFIEHLTSFPGIYMSRIATDYPRTVNGNLGHTSFSYVRFLLLYMHVYFCAMYILCATRESQLMVGTYIHVHVY